MQHGYAKLARGPEDSINLLHAMGIPFHFLLGWATMIVEIVGGLLILLGALVPLATIPMVIVLLVAIFTVHLPNGFSSTKLQSFDSAGAHFGQPGYETESSISQGLSHFVLGELDHFPLTGFCRDSTFRSSPPKMTIVIAVGVTRAKKRVSHPLRDRHKRIFGRQGREG
jgi:putative oxidoreductase